MVGHVRLELIVLNIDLGTIGIARITSIIVHLLILLLDRHLLRVLLVMVVRGLLMLLFNYSLDRRGSCAMHLGFCLRDVVLQGSGGGLRRCWHIGRRPITTTLRCLD